MLRSYYLKADANGAILNAGRPGRGFCVRPGVRPDRAATDAPGHYPLRVQLAGHTDWLEVPNGDAMYVEEGFTGFHISGGTPNAWYCVGVFETKGDGIMPSGSKPRIVRQLFSGTITHRGGAFDPEDVFVLLDALSIYPGARSLQFGFSGTPQDVYLITYAAGGGYFPEVELLHPAAGTWPKNIWRAIDFPSPRILLYASTGAGAAVTIDIEEEVG